MLPSDLAKAALEIGDRWPDALIYSNHAAANGYKRNPDVPDGALAVDVDRVWPHVCEGEDCNGCCGWYELVAWIDGTGAVHYVRTPQGADGV